ncbi:guanylin-like [Heterodontus francisci]|uniref:guanylin-like n=1 Tax=Heterodontus francisci TaxID=7792 RepID=UPI00355C543C
MKTLFAIVFLTSCLSSLMAKVVVQDGDYEFFLDDVKKLWDLMDKNRLGITGIINSHTPTLCNNPELPHVFQPVCASSDAPHVFHRLKEISANADICEICAYVACTGC